MSPDYFTRSNNQELKALYFIPTTQPSVFVHQRSFQVLPNHILCDIMLFPMNEKVTKRKRVAVENIFVYYPQDKYYCSRMPSTEWKPEKSMLPIFSDWKPDKNYYPTHRHIFYEIFYVEERQVQHTINGVSNTLDPGSLILVRPNDAHELRAVSARGFLHCNVTFTIETFNHIKHRYFADDHDFYGGDAKQPQQFILDLKQREWLGLAIDSLSRFPRTLFKIEHFLMDLFGELLKPQPSYEFSNCPPKLKYACQLIFKPEYFRHGTKALAQLTGYSPSHISRELVKHIDETPTELLTRARLDYASNQLLISDKRIAQISKECGFNSPSHFHKIFFKRFRVNPRQYRNHRLVSMQR